METYRAEWDRYNAIEIAVIPLFLASLYVQIIFYLTLENYFINNRMQEKDVKKQKIDPVNHEHKNINFYNRKNF